MAAKKLNALFERVTQAGGRHQAPRPPARRKTLFEALEQRFLLSAELVIPPSVVQQTVLEAPFQINPPGQVQLAVMSQTPPTEVGTLGQQSLGVNVVAERLTNVEAPTTTAVLTNDVAQTMPGSTVALSQFAAYLAAHPATTTQLLIVDAAIPHVSTLVNGLLDAVAPNVDGLQVDSGAQALASENEPQVRIMHRGDVDLVVLDSRFDGVDQISALLSSYQNLNAVHILSHGDSGSLHLGSVQLGGENLDQYQSQIAQWGTSLRSGGDILLYGCDVAQGAYGVNFVQSLARLAGADVAASTDLTGSASKGGNWNLEYSTGNIETHSVKLDAYAFLLDALVVNAGDETFTFANGWGSSTVSKGVAFGDVGTATLDFSSVTAALTFTIDADGSIHVTDGINMLDADAGLIQTLIGGSGINTLVGADTDNTWTITAANAGTLNGTLTFAGIGNLTGGSAKDVFNFDRGAAISGKLDGRGGDKGVGQRPAGGAERGLR